MTKPNATFQERLERLIAHQPYQALKEIKHGVEREALRINQNGSLALTGHPEKLGSALEHEYITTDFSESLLEFITPPESNTDKTLEQLADIHKFVNENIGDERLWPLSMPCYIDDENSIPLAFYGESNIAKMKRVYRVGLKNRYGSMMQVISGVHFNFSLPDTFWAIWGEVTGQPVDQDMVSAQYFSLLRNYRRYSWLIPYLYGASPAICGSFIKDKPHNLPFEKVGVGSYYLPHATSLRLSDLGYTNKEQAKLQICYNELDNYVALLREAMLTKSERFSQFASGEEGNWQQLSPNILQIENELYSSIRPKQPTQSMEKPTDALVRRGVNYIEVRALDVNPYSPVGINKTQFAFLDVFLLTCLIKPSMKLDSAGVQETQANFKSVVLEGRRPGLILQKDGQSFAMQVWAEQLFEEFRQTASLLDTANDTRRYTEAVDEEWDKVLDPSKTFSGRWLSNLLAHNKDNGELGLDLAEQYRAQLRDHNYVHLNSDMFKQQAAASLQSQREKEQIEDVPFDDFIKQYFAEAPAKKNA
ncbi:glutamate--cysteine ligase [Alteromonas sediminis]|uniref:Glutamate--cysteine ligase n=1 Tax=Alteromonas sediminis TaxID=2259342 RepID=A0A3N5Y339_9ALTE|nr:glutamate--cysteine ligase [Alteromonas sediminis]RPJ68397.1 glutamate--cysteine ligase [Alteromonas sediminis]